MSQEDKLLIIKSDVDSFETFMTEGMRREEIDVIPISAFNTAGPLVKRVLHKFRAFMSMDFSEYQRIIVFGDDYIFILMHLFRKKIRSAFWIWNTLPDNRVNRLLCRIYRKWGTAYTFDRKDAQKYGLQLNSQLYVYPEKNSGNSIQRDVYFVGKDKGRRETLEDLAAFFDRHGITYQMQVKPDDGSEWESSGLQKIDWVDYKEIAGNIRESKAILEICKDSQEGMTLRAVEAIFYDKKLITNNLSYEQYDFYDPEKIYIIRDRELAGLPEFIKAETKAEYSKEIKDYYDVREWSERFRKEA